MFRIYQAVTTGTPVDTGFARAGWRMSAGAPSYGPTDRPADPGLAASSARAWSAANDRYAAALSSSYQLTDGTLHVSNAVRYLVYLNRGSSPQAPALFIERAIQAAIVATRAA